MHVMRPVKMDDLDRLLELADLTSFGLTTLPKDRELLQKRIKASLRAFQHLDDTEPSGQAYLFVLEDLEQRLVMGTSGIVAKVGGFEPFYSYRIETTVHESPTLEIRKEIEVLHLDENHNGPCEIGSLFLHPEARGSGNGRLLSFCRFLFMAEHPQLFDPEVVAEMRGVIDDRGRSPFWDALGKHFFDLEFPKADYLSIVNKEFIGDLMPRLPIYIPLLPAAARAAIGEVHELTRPARKLLESEGFVYRNQVDIFEAGPLLHCPRDEIRCVRESRSSPVLRIEDQISAGVDSVVASNSEGFRALLAQVEVTGEGVVLDRNVAKGLQCQVGDIVRHVPLRAAASS
ncbi:arginine N-succinyltransferase [Planctomicrobium sp. SH664]|uniref:arginine N-succinyltransferase n=1 Tax=Planctomicrobium sp. SH664 TaxID=3448125 RepID=UPI003F5B89DE